jgi:group I intron endonuclease
MTSPLSFEKTIPFHDFFQPGIYMICNKITNKYYIGESENVADRISGHYKRLNSNKQHDCAELQADWNCQNGKNFSFEILFSGPEWSDKVLRLQKERELLMSLGKENSYNFAQFIDYREERKKIASVYRSNSIAVVAYGVTYKSIREAAHMNNITCSAARQCLNDLNNTNWSYVDKSLRRHSSLSKIIVIEGKLFVSFNVASDFLKLSTKTLRKYIQEKQNWHYFSDLSPVEQQTLLDANPEIDKLPAYPEGRPVRVGNTIYPTIVACAKEYNVHPSTVRKRIQTKNPLFVDWFWAEQSL